MTYVLVAIVGLTAVSASAQPQSGQPQADRDWATTLRADAIAFHEVVLRSHPGPVDTQNPQFRRVLDSAYRTALRRAKPGIGYPQYYWAMTEFAAAFDDGHLGLSGTDLLPSYKWDFRWPGFTVAYGAGNYVVVYSEGGANRPGVGATLVGCDGAAAAVLTRKVLAPMVGRWSLTTMRRVNGPRLFLRSDNPYRPAMRRCTFRNGDRITTVTLDWQPIAVERRKQLMTEAIGIRPQAKISIEPLGDRGFVIGLGSFDTDPKAATTPALTALVDEVTRRADALAEADVLLFDLRGNNGGSSSWISRIAEAIWGKQYVEAKSVDASYPEYRVSDANIENFRHALADAKTNGDAHSIEWLGRTVAGMETAKAAGRATWADRSTAARAPADSGQNRFHGRAFVFTDYYCGSACLDAVDLLTSLGAVQVGQETIADTLYMDISRQPLPSGLMTMYVPTKVYRGRARGSNVPAVPKYAWTGALDDQDGIRAWVLGLGAAH